MFKRYGVNGCATGWVVTPGCLEYLGGVPNLIVPDNLKKAIAKAYRYASDVNGAYQQWAAHYMSTESDCASTHSPISWYLRAPTPLRRRPATDALFMHRPNEHRLG